MASPRAKGMVRRIAIIAAYSLFFGFAVAALLSLNLRAFDTQSMTIIALMTFGACAGGTLTLFGLRKFVFRSRAARFAVTFLSVVLATLLCDGIFSGLQFYKTAFSLHDGFATLDGWLELIFTGVHGFAYFFVFGLHLFWPALVAAGLLFALATLSLPQTDPSDF